MNDRHSRAVRTWRAWSLFLLALLPALAWTVFDTLFSVRGEPFQTLEIPNLCGMDADQLPPYEHLELMTEYRYDEDVPAGRVLSQSPPAGSRRKLTAQKHRGSRLQVRCWQ